MWMLLAIAIAADPPLSGAYVLDESAEAMTAKHAEALERGLAPLSWAFRPFARPFLERAIWSCGRLSLELNPSDFAAHCDGKDPLTVPRNGEPKAFVGNDGNPCEVTLGVASERVQVSFQCAKGGQHNRYAPGPDGSLLVTREVFSPQLPEPIVWTTRYRPE